MTENGSSQAFAPIIFYGSLMQGQEGVAKSGIAGALHRIGEIRFFGRLFDFGSYPGVRLGGTSRVLGELYDGLTEAVLAKIDAFEECNPDDMAPFDAARGRGSVYRRRLIDCYDGAGRLYGPAWVYEYNGDVTGVPRIDGGDWLAHLRVRS